MATYNIYINNELRAQVGDCGNADIARTIAKSLAIDDWTERAETDGSLYSYDDAVVEYCSKHNINIDETDEDDDAEIEQLYYNRITPFLNYEVKEA